MSGHGDRSEASRGNPAGPRWPWGDQTARLVFGIPDVNPSKNNSRRSIARLPDLTWIDQTLIDHAAHTGVDTTTAAITPATKIEITHAWRQATGTTRS
jgi:hypothetical protein